MRVSRDEAFGLLKKWANESTQVYVFMEGGGFVLRLIGFISVFDPPNLLVAQEGPQFRRTEIAIGLSDAFGFDYTEIREAPEPVRENMGDWMTAGLAFDLPTAKVNVYELLDAHTDKA